MIKLSDMKNMLAQTRLWTPARYRIMASFIPLLNLQHVIAHHDDIFINGPSRLV